MMIKIAGYTLKFAKLPSLVFLCLLALLVSLGLWQTHRATEKREFLQQQVQAQRVETTRLSTAIEDNADLRYKKLEVSGRYDVSHSFLIDNQISEGKAGYFVLTPFILQGEHKAILVNRGWIPSNPDRTRLPDVSSMTAESAVITGRANYFPSVGIKLAGAEIPTDTMPAVVQIVDSQILAKKLGYPLFTFQLELDRTQPNGFKREWQTTTLMPPEQHIAYAIQWFALAFTLTVLFIVYSFKKSS